MLDTIIGLVLISIIMTPGIPGEVIYTHFSGTDWQESQLRSVVRVVMISMLGLSVLMILSNVLGGPPLGYLGLSPSGSLEIPEGYQIGSAYLLHILFSLLWGALIGGLAQIEWFGLRGGRQPYSWDDLVNNHVAGHWVVIDTHVGKTYAGIIETADDYVSPEHRDVLLREPALYSDEDGCYESMAYQHIFLPAALIESIAVVYDEEIDERITEIGEKLF